jgi:hypothetical protein
VNIENLSPYLLLPFLSVLGIILLVWCIQRLIGVTSPRFEHRFSVAAEPQRVSLPAAGRYVVAVVIPPMTFVPGTAHFAAQFAVTSVPTGGSIGYRAYRWAPFRVHRSDGKGKTAYPLGEFECGAAVDVEIRCLNPESIRSDFALEVAPYVSPLRLAVLIPLTLLGVAMTGGGLALFLLWLGGRI